MLNAEMKIYPGKEMLALDMAEVLETSVINSGIIQGCGITYSGGTLTLDPGRILIRGRLGYFSGGQIPTTGISASGTYKLLAVCDLAAQDGSMFYVDFFSTATGGDYDTLRNRVEQQNGHFNSIDGAAFVELGTATIDSATGNVTAWTPSNTGVKRDAVAYAAIEKSLSDNVNTINQSITTNVSNIYRNANDAHALMTQKINAWATYFNKRTSSYGRFINETVTVPSFTIPAGSRVGCTFPAIRGTTYRATGTNSRTESKPSWVDFTQIYTTMSDGTKIPLNVDEAAVRYVALAVTNVLFSNAAYNNKGKNANKCVMAGMGVYGVDYDRRGVVYAYNAGTAEAIVDLQVAVLYVRRG